MDAAVGLQARLLLAFVFVASALAKSGSLTEFVAAVEEIGIWRTLAPVIARAVLLAEVGIGVAVLLVPDSPAPPAVAAGVLLVFIAIAIRGWGRGTGTCQCFGSLLRERTGWWTVARNLCLVGIAIAAAFEPVPAPNYADVAVSALAAAGLLMLYAQSIRLLGIEATTEKSSVRGTGV